MEPRHSEDIKINQSIHQGCNLSPTLFHIYLNNVIREWKKRNNKRILLKQMVPQNILLFTNIRYIAEDLECALQRNNVFTYLRS
jgi:hypothetical protein